MKTTLKKLRGYDTWQDRGQTGEDPSLTDDTVVELHPNGDAYVGEGILLCYGAGMEWIRFVNSLQGYEVDEDHD